MTCPILSHLPVRSHVCMRPALCGPHSRPHARLRWRSRLRLRMSGLLARAWERAVLPSALMLNPPTTNPQVQPTNLGGSARYGIGLLAPGRAAGLRIWHAARPRLGFPIPNTVRARGCLPRLPDSLQPFPPVSPERGGASCLPRPANRLSFIQPRDSFAEPRDSPTRDPARAGATVGRSLPAVRACQVWGLGVKHWCRSLDDCPPFSLEIWGWDRESVFF